VSTPARAAAGHSPFIRIVVVAAVAENGVIGRDDALPWRLKSDMAHFRALTLGKPVVMGRKTYLSIGKPLAGRTNIVVSRKATFAAPGVVAVPTLDHALEVARGDALRRSADAIAVIGGAEIFRQTLPMADRLEITRIHAWPDGDTLFPAFDPAAWREVNRVDHPGGPSDSAAFTFLRYERACSLSQPTVGPSA
jgi:dihydrofolate reductase